MQLKEVSVTKSFTRNLGNFESARVEFGAVATVGEGDKSDDVKTALEAKVDSWVVEAVNEVDADRA
jgi:hypothetical protein